LLPEYEYLKNHVEIIATPTFAGIFEFMLIVQ